jgi:hypothetical protein
MPIYPNVGQAKPAGWGVRNTADTDEDLIEVPCLFWSAMTRRRCIRRANDLCCHHWRVCACRGSKLGETIFLQESIEVCGDVSLKVVVQFSDNQVICSLDTDITLAWKAPCR